MRGDREGTELVTTSPGEKRMGLRTSLKSAIGGEKTSPIFVLVIGLSPDKACERCNVNLHFQNDC